MAALPRQSALTLIFLSAVATAAAASEPCPPGRTVKLDPTAWAARVKRATTLAALNAALADAGLAPREECVGGLGADDGDPPRVRVRVADAFKAPIDPAGREVRVLNVLGTSCEPSQTFAAPGTPEFQRGAVLVATGPNQWCRVDAPFLNADGSGWGPMLCNPTVFGFYPLVSASRHSLRVVETQEWCGGAGSHRGSSSALSFWEVRGFDLVALFSVDTLEGRYHSAAAVGWSREAKVTFSRAFPRTLTVTTATSCMYTAEELAGDGEDTKLRREIAADYPCPPVGTKRSVFTWDGQRYVQR